MLCLVDRTHPVTAYYGRDDRGGDRGARLVDQKRTGFVVARKKSGRPEFAVHMAVRLSRTGCPVHYVKSYYSLGSYRYPSVQLGIAQQQHGVHQQIRVVPKSYTTLVELERSSRHCCPETVVAEAGAVAVYPQKHAVLALGMTLVEPVLSSLHCLNFARRWNIRNCCSGPAESISI